MHKTFIPGILLLFTSVLSAQTVVVESVLTDTIAKKTNKKNFFVSAINFIIGECDTAYVAPNKYEFAIMTTYYNNNEYYSIRSTDPKTQHLRFSPRPSNKIGFYVGWRFIFLGWSFDVNDAFHKKKGQKNGTSVELSLYSARFGVDLIYQKTGNDYIIHKAKGLAMFCRLGIKLILMD